MKRSGDGGSDHPSSGGAFDHAPLSQWIAATLASLLVLAILGYTLREGLTRPGRPPVLHVETDSIVTTAAGHLVLFTVRNEGGTTAAAVQVRGRIAGDAGRAEEAAATIDFVPIGAGRSAGLQFESDPEGLPLDLRVVGFSHP